MSCVYLLLGGPDFDRDKKKCKWYLGGIITTDGYHVFSIYDFLQIALISYPEPQKSRRYVEQLWKNICHQHPQFMYVEGTLELAVPSSKMRKTTPKQGATTGTTVAGLRAVLDVLGRNQVSDANRKNLEDIFARYHAGDKSMLVFVNINDKVHPQIPHFNYNFQPPTVSNGPVASIVVEDAEAGAARAASSRESSSTSMEFDFTSTEDHVVRALV
jgi:hypothetical protein